MTKQTVQKGLEVQAEEHSILLQKMRYFFMAVALAQIKIWFEFVTFPLVSWVDCIDS